MADNLWRWHFLNELTRTDSRYPELNGSAAKVLTLLISMANAGGRAWPSHKCICDRCGLSRSSVKRAIAELESADLVAVVEGRGAGRKCVYQLRALPGMVDLVNVGEADGPTLFPVEKRVRGRTLIRTEKGSRANPKRVHGRAVKGSAGGPRKYNREENHQTRPAGVAAAAGLAAAAAAPAVADLAAGELLAAAGVPVAARAAVLAVTDDPDRIAQAVAVWRSQCGRGRVRSHAAYLVAALRNGWAADQVNAAGVEDSEMQRGTEGRALRAHNEILRAAPDRVRELHAQAVALANTRRGRTAIRYAIPDPESPAEYPRAVEWWEYLERVGDEWRTVETSAILFFLVRHRHIGDVSDFERARRCLELAERARR